MSALKAKRLEDEKHPKARSMNRRKKFNQTMKRPQNITLEQWNLPAGLKADGSFATLAEVVTPVISTLSLMNLNSDSRRKLVLERIKLQKSYPTISFLGLGNLDKETIIKEVEDQTAIGKVILEAEQNAIQVMIGRVKPLL